MHILASLTALVAHANASCCAGPDVIVLCLSHCCLSVLSLSLFVALLCVSQETWTKACLTAAEFVITCGKQGVAVLKRMEESGKISGYTLKPLESITVPEDWLWL